MLAYVGIFFRISNSVTSRTPTRFHRPTSKLQCSIAASNNYLPKIIKNVNIFQIYCQMFVYLRYF